MSSQQQYHDSNEEQEENDVEQQQLQEEGESSVTAAEPIDDDQHCVWDDSRIPTIRLSSLGGSLEEDFEAVQAEYHGNKSGSSGDEEMGDAHDHDGEADMSERYYDAEEEMTMTATSLVAAPKSAAACALREDEDSTSAPSSEEMLVDQSLLLPSKPGRQRLVSEDGVIAEFDIDGGSLSHRAARGEGSAENDTSDDEVRVVAEAIEIDASFRSVGDLELGDEEPLPYSGRRSSFSSLRARALGHSSASGGGGGGRSSGILRSATGQYARPELISATVIKNSPMEQIGISLLRDETAVYSISREEESLLKDCPFQAGDKILSINNKRTEHMDSAEAARVLREVTGFITIVVHNPPGDPCLIETMITKANKNQRSGMGLKSTGERDLRVSSINENGLFAQSLLNVGDRILSINNCDVTEVDARVACDIIKNAPNHVTVVARSRHTHGVVVAEVSSRGLNNASSDNVLTSVPEGTTLRRHEIEAVDDTCSMGRRQREQLIIGACIGIIIVAVMVGVFGSGSDGG